MKKDNIYNVLVCCFVRLFIFFLLAENNTCAEVAVERTSASGACHGLNPRNNISFEDSVVGRLALVLELSAQSV